jgi:hypothetical protein
MCIVHTDFGIDLKWLAIRAGAWRPLFFAVYEGVPEGEKPESGPRNYGQEEQQLIVIPQTKQGEQVIEAELGQYCKDNENNECQPSFHFI